MFTHFQLNRVVTQFDENKVTQFFVQNGKRIEIPGPTYDGLPSGSAITPEYCENQFKVFDDRDRFSEVGGFTQLNAAFRVPMTLVMSIWDDVSFFVDAVAGQDFFLKQDCTANLSVALL